MKNEYFVGTILFLMSIIVVGCSEQNRETTVGPSATKEESLSEDGGSKDRQSQSKQTTSVELFSGAEKSGLKNDVKPKTKSYNGGRAYSKSEELTTGAIAESMEKDESLKLNPEPKPVPLQIDPPTFTLVDCARCGKKYFDCTCKKFHAK